MPAIKKSKNWLSHFLELPKGRAIAVSAGLMLLIMAADYLTNYQVTLINVYVIPILILAWNAGFGWALAGACASGLFAVLVSLSIGYPYTNVWYLIFAIGSAFAVHVVAAAVAANLRRVHDALLKVSSTDHLTQLANRRQFEECADLELQRHRRFGEAFSLLVFDCDNFKAVNDTLGHAEGDRLLVTLAERIRARVRATDVAARLGGDEFAIILPRTAADDAGVFAASLLSQLDEAMAGRQWQVGFSAGLITFASHLPENVDEAMSAADKLMYTAKEAGKRTLRAAVY